MKTDAIAKMLEIPGAKIAWIDNDYDLILTSLAEEKSVTTDAYVLVSHHGAIAKIHDFVWQAYDQELIVPTEIGIVSPTQSSLYARSVDFAANRARPILPFVLFVWVDSFVEAYIATPTTKGQRHYMWPEKRVNELFTLCFNEIKEHDPDIATQINKFMLAIGAASCSEDDNN